MPSGPINRRIFLQRAFAFSAAASLAGCGRGTSMVDFEPQQSFQQATDGPANLLMIGDWGWSGDTSQAQVAEAMQVFVLKKGLTIDALLLLGDNFYDDLPGGASSPFWQTRFEQMYPQSHFNCPAFAILGNHDYQYAPESKVIAELAYAAAVQTRWTMPGRYYRFTVPYDNPLITILALDSNMPNEPANPRPPNPSFYTPTPADVAAQQQWLAAELQKPLTTPFLMVMGHHPMYSNGVFGDNATLVRSWDSLLRQHGVHLYVSGHNHDLEHLEFAGHPTSFVVSGGGGAWLSGQKTSNGATGYFSESHGFTLLKVHSNLLTVRHIDPNGNVLHAFSKTPEGVVTILS